MWSSDKLKEWARPALRYEELVAIARIAPSARRAKNQALEFAKNQGLGEEIAKACRWLMIIRRDCGQETQQEFISSAREEIAREERKMEEKIEKTKKVKKFKKGWPLYLCPLCQKYQQVEGRCKHCGFEKTKRKVVKTGAEYCELLKQHEYEKSEEREWTLIATRSYRCWGDTVRENEYLWPFRCIRCGHEKLEQGCSTT